MNNYEIITSLTVFSRAIEQGSLEVKMKDGRWEKFTGAISDFDNTPLKEILEGLNEKTYREGPLVVNGVSCYGEFKLDSNVVVAGDFKYTGMEFEEVWCGDESEPKSWTEVMRILQPWADRINLEILQLEAC